MTEQPVLSQSVHLAHVHPEHGVEQVGWIGQTGNVYALDDPPYDDREPGSFAPLYQAREESCWPCLDDKEAAGWQRLASAVFGDD